MYVCVCVCLFQRINCIHDNGVFMGEGVVEIRCYVIFISHFSIIQVYIEKIIMLIEIIS